MFSTAKILGSISRLVLGQNAPPFGVVVLATDIVTPEAPGLAFSSQTVGPLGSGITGQTGPLEEGFYDITWFLQSVTRSSTALLRYDLRIIDVALTTVWSMRIPIGPGGEGPTIITRRFRISQGYRAGWITVDPIAAAGDVINNSVNAYPSIQ